MRNSLGGIVAPLGSSFSSQMKKQEDDVADPKIAFSAPRN